MKIDYEKMYPLAYKYNELYKRFEKALRWFGDKSIPLEMMLKQEKNLCKIIKEMGELNKQIIDLGHKITSIEAYEGYDLIELSKKIDVSKYGLQLDLNKK